MIERKKFIPALGYDFLSVYYDAAIKLTMPEAKFRGKLILWLNPRAGERILEFGFGTGQNLILLNKEESDAEVQGVDIDPKIKSIAEHKLSAQGMNVPLHLYNGVALPFLDNSFDKVFSSLVFHQLDRETKINCLKEIHRVLRPGGEITISDWGKAKNKWVRLGFYLVQLLDGFKTTTDNVNGLLPEFIKSAGFSGVTEIDFINTNIGTYSYYTAQKP